MGLPYTPEKGERHGITQKKNLPNIKHQTSGDVVILSLDQLTSTISIVLQSHRGKIKQTSLDTNILST